MGQHDSLDKIVDLFDLERRKERMKLARALAAYCLKYDLKERPLEGAFMPFRDARIWDIVKQLASDKTFRHVLEGTVNEFSPAILSYTLHIYPSPSKDLKGSLFLNPHYH